MQMIGAGALGPQAAGAIRHVAVQNGVWSLGNFGGVPPRSAMGFYNNVSFVVILLLSNQLITVHVLTDKYYSFIECQESNDNAGVNANVNNESEVRQVTHIEEHEYRHVFNSCAVAMVSLFVQYPTTCCEIMFIAH